MDDNLLPVRVMTSHEAAAIGRDGELICVCGAKHPCDSRKQAAVAQLRTAALITAAMAVDYVRLITAPRLSHVAHQVHDRLFGWIPDAVAAERARGALRNVTGWWRNQWESRITHGSGLPNVPRGGPPQYGDVVDRDHSARAGTRG